MPTSTKSIRALVDRLGELKAEIADLTSEEKQLKELLIGEGDGPLEGYLFRCTVTTSERSFLDMDAVRAKLTPQFIKAHTKKVISTVVRVVARVRDAA